MRFAACDTSFATNYSSPSYNPNSNFKGPWQFQAGTCSGLSFPKSDLITFSGISLELGQVSDRVSLYPKQCAEKGIGFTVNYRAMNIIKVHPVLVIQCPAQCPDYIACPDYTVS